MKIHQFVFNLFQENTYLITDSNGDAIVIDPGFSNQNEYQSFKTYLNKHTLSLKKVILTHGHIDHISG
ncbi:MAG TPA: MBL fold metallo-hydrolase, partial [Bacteroidales bacterium]|nr:MBL fold metallo-hydrolase [Bacteroidales bacterium]